MLCQFLLYSLVTQYMYMCVYIYIYEFFFLILSSLMFYPKRLDIVPCTIEQDLIAYLL